jgi:uncharacterized delta-60 repeat protein
MRTLLFAVILFSSSFAKAQPGALDSTFGTNGVTLTKFYLGGARAKAMAIQPDGKIILAGFSYEDQQNTSSVAKYLPNGQLDSSFGVDGKVNKRNSHGFNAIALQTDGKILLQCNSLTGDTALMLRYHNNGTPDNSFGDKGSVMIDIDIEGYIAVQPDGKIIVAGMESSPSGYNIAVARYKKYGKIDSTFGNNGKVITEVSGSAFVTSVTIQPDGKIIVGGYRSTIVQGYTQLDFLIARYNVNGSADSSFNNDGIRVASFDYKTVGQALALQPDGRIIIAGYSIDHRSNFAMARYKKNGTVDTSFGNKGLKLINFDGPSDAYAVALQPDGKVILAGYSNDYNAIALARCTADGPVDTTFDGDGKVITDILWSSRAEAVAIQADGKIVVGGYANNNGRYNFALIRYKGDGTGVNAKNNYTTAGENKESNSNPTNIYLSPNPVKDVLYVQRLNPLTSKTISLIDNNGKVVQKITTSNSSYSFNVQHLPVGIYFIRIDDKKKIATLKFVKE